MVEVLRPRSDEHYKLFHRQIFLAGTIDMGNSRNWQEEFTDIIKNKTSEDMNVQIFNPRRVSGAGFNGDKDKSELIYQINWELSHLEKSNMIIMNILGDSKSPISLLELGLFKDKNIFVICPEEYYRFVNVKITCQRYNIKFFTSETDFWRSFDMEYFI